MLQYNRGWDIYGGYQIIAVSYGWSSIVTVLAHLQTNTFQCVMATDGTSSFVIFLYADDEIQWTTGEQPDGSGGTEPTPALVGFSAGDGVRFTSVQGSQTEAIINITMTSNVARPGVWVFKVDEENIIVGGCTMETEGMLLSRVGWLLTVKKCPMSNSYGFCLDTTYSIGPWGG